MATQLDSVLMKVRRAYEDLDYEFERNGESEVPTRFEMRHGVKTIFDVGASNGTCPSMAGQFCPTTEICAFEITAETN